MGLAHAPRIVTNDLFLAYDPSSPKSYVGINTYVKNFKNHTADEGYFNGNLLHSQGPFPDAGYVSFGGVDDLYTSASSDFTFGTTPFTVEAWIYPTSLPSSEAMICSFGGNIYGWSSSKGYEYTFYIDSNGALKSNLYDGSTSFNSIASSTGQISANTWQHVALCGNGSTTKIFINGVEKGSVNEYPRTITSPAYFTIGSAKSQGNATNDYYGYITNFRLVKGTALYTSNFTPSTTPLTAIDNTKLLTCQGSSIVDASLSNHSITNNGTTVVYDSTSYFDCDGTDDYIQITGLNRTTLGDQYTISVWVKFDVDGSDTAIWQLSNTPSSNWSSILLQKRSGYIRFWAGLKSSAAGYVLNKDFISTNTWYNFVITRSGLYYALYANGTIPTGNNEDGEFTDLTTYNGDYHASSTDGNFFIANGYNGTLDGKIGAFHIYKRRLSAAEIRQNFNALRGRYRV